MLMVQTDLESYGTHMTTWLPKDARVKVRSLISLKGNDAIWTVVKQYDPIDSSQIQRGWNVGGIETVH